MATGAELSYNTGASATQMANAIFGDGVTVVSATYSGPAASKAIYSNGDALSPEATPSNSGVILSTGNVADFTQSSGDPNRSAGTSTDTAGANNNALFNALAGTNTFDAVWLETVFVPTGNVMTIRFTFASEEYPEYINTAYNDLVGVWINGQPVQMVVGDGRISVTNVNGANNPNLYFDNTGDAFNTEMDGFTLTMTLTIPVNSGVNNTLRIGIADVGDATYDSAVLIAGDSIQTTLVAIEDYRRIFPNTAKTIDVLANDVNATAGVLTITHINGVAVAPGQTVTLPSGEQVTLNADGTLTVLADGDKDVIHFTYDVQSSTGQVDTGFVTITSVPCFVAGTLIATPSGEVPVERLAPGDLVLTRDEGPRPLRWTGRRRVPATGAFAPIRIAAGALGAHRTLCVSPQHRVLVCDGMAELLFGEAEVLVAAKDLVNDRSVRAEPGGEVEYVHLLFDRHQIVWAEGLATESFLPGPQIANSFEREALEEILALFPELDPLTGAGYGHACRRGLKRHEAQVLRARSALS